MANHGGCDAAYLGPDIVVAIDEERKPCSVTMHSQYTCAACSADVILRRTKHERYNVSAFFAHKSDSKTRGCNGGGPETQEHLRCKYYLRKYIGHYDFCVQRCPNYKQCKYSMGFVTKPTDLVEIEKTMRVDSKQYRYDLLVSRRGKPVVAMEILHTHVSSIAKIEDTRRHGVALVEIKTSDILQRVEMLYEAKARGSNETVSLPNQTEVIKICKDCLRAQRYHELVENEKLDNEDSWFRLVASVAELEDDRFRAYRLIEEHRRYKKLQHKAYRQAEEFEEIHYNQKQRRVMYNKSNFKCGGCLCWRAQDDMHCVFEAKFDRNEYQDLHSWYVDRGLEPPPVARYCSTCVLECPSCGDDYPYQSARRYGLCRECNIRAKKAYQPLHPPGV